MTTELVGYFIVNHNFDLLYASNAAMKKIGLSIKNYFQFNAILQPLQLLKEGESLDLDDVIGESLSTKMTITKAKDVFVVNEYELKTKNINDNQFKLLFEQTGQTIYNYNLLDDSIQWYGNTFLVCGRSIFEMQNSNIFQWENSIFEKDRERVMNQLNFSREKNVPFNIEYRYLQKDGSYKYIEDIGIFLCDETGETTNMIGIMKNVNARKNLERELLLTRSAINSAGEMMIRINKEGFLIDVNEMTCAKLEYLREELYMKNISELDASYTAEKWETYWDEVKSRKSILIKSKITSRTKKVYPVEIAASFIGFDKEEYLIAFIRDITKRVRIEEALKVSETQYRNLFDYANDAIIVFRPSDEVILEVNSKACEMYGIHKNEFLGMSLKNVTKNVSKGEEQIAKILKDGTFRNFESTHYSRDGKAIDLLVSSSLIEYKGQAAILSISRDITDRKLAEQKILTQNEKLREIARIQSHEIRRPLANILGIIDLLSKKSQVTQSEDLVDLLLKSSMELENVIRDVVWQTTDPDLLKKADG